MNTPAQRRYRFGTPAQWRACLFERVERASFEREGRVQPIAPYGQGARHYASRGGQAPALTRTGEILWHDAAGALYRLAACDDEPRVDAAPGAIGHAARIVPIAGQLWVVGGPFGALERYAADTLSRLDLVAIGDARVLDIAAAGGGMLFALVERAGQAQAVRIDSGGRILDTVSFDDMARAGALVFLRNARRFVVMAGGERARLCWFALEGGGALKSIPVGALHPCFSATALGSDGHDRVFVAGNDGAQFGGRPVVLVFDDDGEPLDEIVLDPGDGPVSGLAGGRTSLLVTGPRGLRRYLLAHAVPGATTEVHCSLVTPALYSPDRADARRWLRIEADASLPDGAVLEISYASTDDTALHRRLTAMAGDVSVPESLRMRRLLREPGLWTRPVVFHGSAAPPGATAGPLAAPLFDVHAPYVWVCVKLSAAAGGSLPSLRELSVLYAGQTLMEKLPAIYRREEARPGSFLRSLVGVIESTTHGLDQRIAAIASQVHPATAAGPWLDFVAGWLGLPWDDALDEGQKQRLVARASDLARGRGTRAGLEALLACLIPGTPPRFRVTDATADAGFAVVDGGGRLPLLLGGRSAWNTELDFGTVLGRMRLPCEGQAGDGVRGLAGLVLVDVAATLQERSAWEPWLGALIDAMLPLTARARLRWVGMRGLHGMRLDGSLVLEAAPAPELGSGAVLGLARLPEQGEPTREAGAQTGMRPE